MCGIVTLFGVAVPEKYRPLVLRMVQKIRHRGPDWSGIFCGGSAVLAHERLAIVDPASGRQPIFSKDRKLILAVNGEIYNHREIRARLTSSYEFTTGSDCEVINALYRERGPSFLDQLNGIFAFALYDLERDVYFVARDHLGIVPLYSGTDSEGLRYFASELKSLEGVCTSIAQFPPGCQLFSPDGEIREWYHRDWTSYPAVQSNSTDLSQLRAALEAAVQRQLMTDVPYGVLLSGGLDSSVIAAIAKKFAALRIETDSTEAAWWPQLHSFAIGLENSPDLAAARVVANHIKSVHHEVHYTVQEGLDAIRDVIYHIETYDVTTVRASTPMYLLARVVKSMGVKMVLSGEGADEVFGGYLYFHKAPGAKELHEETVRKISKLYMYDCLRANKALASWGVEGRVPFLDVAFLDVAMRVNPADKLSRDGRIEKWVLRKACEDLLPADVVWRQKEQFSDGVGYGWIDSLRKITSDAVSDLQMKNAAMAFPVNPPRNKEEYYYRTIFQEHFPSATAAATVPSVPSVACSTAEALAWDAAFQNMNEPSGRAVSGVHLSGLD
jgi:asparagine synthase (glutamine-hydrolysing)